MKNIKKQANQKRKAKFRRVSVGVSEFGREFEEDFWAESRGLKNIEIRRILGTRSSTRTATTLISNF